MEDFRGSYQSDFEAVNSEAFDRPTARIVEIRGISQKTSDKRISFIEPSSSGSVGADRKRFRKHLQAWLRDTELLSSSHGVYFHPSYQRIIGMGKAALPFIREELERNNGDWMWALSCITDKNLVPQEKWGNYAAARKIWLQWLNKNT